MDEPVNRLCSRCGAAAKGNFCSACGASLGHRACAHCQAELSAQARFCHRCGYPAASPVSAPTGSDRRAWTVAAILCVLLVGTIAYQVSDAAPTPAVPDMANAGASGGPQASGGIPAGPAPDISAMTPRQRFDRLFNRIMQAAERRDSAEVARFTPMALGAYDQLDARDADARYHAAILHMQVGSLEPARALADTILAESPRHLFGYIVRGEVAKLQRAEPDLARARRDFLSQYSSEMATKRVEYLEHEPVVEEFRKEAEGAGR